MHETSSLCAAIRAMAAEVYDTFAGPAQHDDLRVFWQRMAARHRSNPGPGPDSIDSGSAQKEIADIHAAVGILLKLSKSVRDATNALFLACRLECYLLHPAFEDGRNRGEGGDDGKHLDELLEMLNRFAVLTPEMQLFGTAFARLSARNRELSGMMAGIHALNGMLPICASCKSIRNEQGEWMPLESYVSSRSSANFTHGICPECARRLYPDLYDEISDGAEGD